MLCWSSAHASSQHDIGYMLSPPLVRTPHGRLCSARFCQAERKVPPGAYEELAGSEHSQAGAEASAALAPSCFALKALLNMYASALSAIGVHNPHRHSRAGDALARLASHSSASLIPAHSSAQRDLLPPARAGASSTAHLS